jgi:hypothetical protein
LPLPLPPKSTLPTALVYRIPAKTQHAIMCYAAVWSGRAILMFRLNLPPPSSGNKQIEMTAIIQKTTVKLQLGLTQERNTERNVEGVTKKKGRSLRKTNSFHHLCYKRQSMRYKNQVLSGRWLQHHSLFLETTAKGKDV